MSPLAFRSLVDVLVCFDVVKWLVLGATSCAVIIFVPSGFPPCRILYLYCKMVKSTVTIACKLR